MKRCVLICTFLLFSCAEVDKSNNRKIEPETKPKEEAENIIEPAKKDSIPEAVFKKISEITFVKERFEKLDKQELSYYFTVDFDVSYYPDKYHLQVLVDTEFRAIPIYNFYYQPETKKLFFLETIENDDVLTLIE